MIITRVFGDISRAFLRAFRPEPSGRFISRNITAYLLINAIYSYQKKSTKRWTELNRGLNKMGFAFIIIAQIFFTF